MIQHHPADHHLVALASGSMDSGRGFVVSAHVEGCVECRRRVEDFVVVGGEIIQTIEPLNVAPDSFAQTLQRIEAASPRSEASPAMQPQARFPREAVVLLPPRLMQGCSGEPWRWVGPGIRYSEIRVPHALRSKVFLLKIAPGRTLPPHSHDGCEFTQVLSGSFNDGRASFNGGDFDETDPHVTHQPVVTADGECVCLAYLDAPLKFSGWIARAAARWTALSQWGPASSSA